MSFDRLADCLNVWHRQRCSFWFVQCMHTKSLFCLQRLDSTALLPVSGSASPASAPLPVSTLLTNLPPSPSMSQTNLTPSSSLGPLSAAPSNDPVAQGLTMQPFNGSSPVLIHSESPPVPPTAPLPSIGKSPLVQSDADSVGSKGSRKLDSWATG